MSIVVMGAVFVDIKGYPLSSYIPGGRNAGRVVQVHGGVSRNIVEDIANVELRPTFVSLVDNTSAGADIVKKLQSHKVDTRYIRTTPDGMGMWLAIFDNTGDVTASISKRPDLSPIADILDEQGDEIFSQADSILLEIDMEKDIVKRTFALAEKHRKPVYAVVSNMSIAIERRDFLRSVHCFICNQQEAGILFSENYDGLSPDEMLPVLRDKIRGAQIRRMVVTMEPRPMSPSVISAVRNTKPSVRDRITYGITKTAPPLLPASHGNFQIAPSPTAAPAEASTNPAFEAQVARSGIAARSFVFVRYELKPYRRERRTGKREMAYPKRLKESLSVPRHGAAAEFHGIALSVPRAQDKTSFRAGV